MFTFKIGKKTLEIQDVHFSKSKSGKITCTGEGTADNNLEKIGHKVKGSGFLMSEALEHMLEQSMHDLEKKELFDSNVVTDSEEK